MANSSLKILIQGAAFASIVDVCFFDDPHGRKLMAGSLLVTLLIISYILDSIFMEKNALDKEVDAKFKEKETYE
jgi:hypothetical protein